MSLNLHVLFAVSNPLPQLEGHRGDGTQSLRHQCQVMQDGFLLFSLHLVCKVRLSRAQCQGQKKILLRSAIEKPQSKPTSERSRNSTWTRRCIENYEDFIKTNLKTHKKGTKPIVFYLTALVILINIHFNPTNVQKHVLNMV